MTLQVEGLARLPTILFSCQLFSCLITFGVVVDATNYIMARFYPAGTVLTHMDLLGRWVRRNGRPLGLYTDRHSIFEPQDKGRALPDAETQFGRALRELGVELIRAHSPQAKGYASSCTSFVFSGATLGMRRGSVRLTPCHFLGPSGPVGS
jgi:hypothetical protein